MPLWQRIALRVFRPIRDRHYADYFGRGVIVVRDGEIPKGFTLQPLQSMVFIRGNLDHHGMEDTQ